MLFWLILWVGFHCVHTQTNNESLGHHHNLSIFFTNLEPCHETLNANIAHPFIESPTLLKSNIHISVTLYFSYHLNRILVLRLIGDCKHDNRSHDSLLNQLLKKSRGMLATNCDGGKLWLATKGDGLKIYDLYNDKKMLIFSHDLLYYHVKAWMIIFHDYVILKEF